MPKFKSVCIYHNHMWISISMCMRFYTHGAMNHQSYCSSQKVRVTWGPSLKRLHNGWMFITKFTCRLQELERSINSLFRHLFACKILWRPVICKLRRQKRYQSCSFFFFYLTAKRLGRIFVQPWMPGPSAVVRNLKSASWSDTLRIIREAIEPHHDISVEWFNLQRFVISQKKGIQQLGWLISLDIKNSIEAPYSAWK